MRISAGREPHEKPSVTTRAPGFPYWTIACFVRGKYEFSFPAAEESLHIDAPAIVVLSPGTPYRLNIAGGPRWLEYYMLFAPRDEWLAWMQWPQGVAGCSVLRIASRVVRDRIIIAAAAVCRCSSVTSPSAEAFAYNGLERFLLLLREAHPTGSSAQPIDARILQAMRYIATNLAHPLSVETIAAAVGISTSSLAHLFSKQVGQTPMRYVEDARLRVARDQLLRTTRPINEIAAEIGFDNAFHFSTRFRKRVGQSPRAYRSRPIDRS